MGLIWSRLICMKRPGCPLLFSIESVTKVGNKLNKTSFKKISYRSTYLHKMTLDTVKLDNKERLDKEQIGIKELIMD